MKEVPSVAYEAFDGQRFFTREECADYEDNIWWRRLVGLTQADLEAAFDRTNLELGAAIEKAAYRIRTKRYEDGDLKRRGKPDDAPRISTNPEDRQEPEDEAA